MTACRDRRGGEEDVTQLLSLDDTAARDAMTAGAKAARLARARGAGLPALPGVVVPAAAGAGVLRAAVEALRAGGSGAARLAAMQAPVDERLVADVGHAIVDLGPPAIVRSSSPLESGGVWSGAFSSLEGIGPGDARTALRGVWASAFTPHALERCEQAGVDPGDLVLAVLVQPEVRPTAGGTARVLPSGDVDVVATAGPPRDLLAGWVGGVRAHVAADGFVRGDEATRVVGPAPLGAAADLARAVAEQLGDRLVEWAWVNGQIVLLQSAAGAPAEPAAAGVCVTGLDDPVALRVARLAVRCPGPLGEALVLGWAAGTPELLALPDTPSRDPARDLEVATAEARELLKAAWQERPDRAAAAARRTLAALRGPDPQPALAALHRLRPVDPARGGRVVALLQGVATAVSARGNLPDDRRLWRCTPEDANAVVTGAGAGPAQARIGPDRWEPFVHAVCAGQGRACRGLPAAAGIAAGRVCVVANPHDPPSLADRDVVIAGRPLPALAPLLWTAGALVTAAGSPAAHLLEVAHSLGVPAVVAADLDALAPGGLAGLTSGAWIAAVDGDRGSVALVAA